MAKMTLDKARQIRALAAETPRSTLAEKYGVSVTLIGRIVRNESYPEPAVASLGPRERLIAYLGDSYSPEDDELIGLYCDTADLRERMQRELGDGDLMSEYTNKAAATNLVKNPLIGEIKSFTATMTSLLVQLGLTRKQRLRMSEGPGDDNDGFEDF